MKQNLKTNNGQEVRGNQKFMGYLAIAALVAALAFGARQYINGQEELTRQLGDTETIGRLEEMDRINYALRLMNAGKLSEAKQELQSRLRDEMRILHSELPLANPGMQLLAEDLCRRIPAVETTYPVYSMRSLPLGKPATARASEGIDEDVVRPTKIAAKSGI
jgi:hypothetical protein